MEQADVLVQTQVSNSTLPLLFALGSDETNVVAWGSLLLYPVYIWLLTCRDSEKHPNKVQLK